MSARPYDPGIVYVVDDDEAVRDALAMLFRAAGLRAMVFASGPAFLEKADPAARGCLVLDIRMPGQSGTELQAELNARGVRIPIVFITGHGDIPMAVAAVKRGAFDFIEKPFDDHRLLAQVHAALASGVAAQRGAERGAALQARLSSREREVLARVLEGKPSRQIAEELFISTKTVEFHRARIMGKAGVRTVAQLFRVFLAGDASSPS